VDHIGPDPRTGKLRRYVSQIADPEIVRVDEPHTPINQKKRCAQYVHEGFQQHPEGAYNNSSETNAPSILRIEK